MIKEGGIKINAETKESGDGAERGETICSKVVFDEGSLSLNKFYTRYGSFYSVNFIQETKEGSIY